MREKGLRLPQNLEEHSSPGREGAMAGEEGGRSHGAYSEEAKRKSVWGLSWFLLLTVPVCT